MSKETVYFADMKCPVGGLLDRQTDGLVGLFLFHHGLYQLWASTGIMDHQCNGSTTLPKHFSNHAVIHVVAILSVDR